MRMRSLWRSLFASLAVSKVKPRAVPSRYKDKTIAFCVGSKLDLDLLVPIIVGVQRNPDLRCILIIARAVLDDFDEIEDLILSFKGGYWELNKANLNELSTRVALNVGAVVTGVESNLKPHFLVYNFVSQLNKLNINTYTIQHGLDNIGLTYTDHIHPIGNVAFASNVIFTWLPLDSLHSEVSQEVYDKCVHSGCTKVIPEERGVMPGVSKVGVFENIHWHRYSEQYKLEFLVCLNAVAKKFPLVEFIVKPHPSGRWLTRKYSGQLAEEDNITILKQCPVNGDSLASSSALLQDVDAVITTPSTVALDAAIAGLPVAVFSAELDLPRYMPLCLLPNSNAWIKFIADLDNVDIKKDVIEKGLFFTRRYYSAGNAVQNIISRICIDLAH